ncbi:MAG: alpha-N-arabinofuranosidase [Eubacterium sp.]|jgi:GH43 family beta-xylosidase|nr:alpha-N-arabinofuranosidase [Eubacterium sp.]
MNNDKYILCYTREPQDGMIYSEKLAYSMHLAYSEDGRKFEPLNHNSGVLFAKATDNHDKTMKAKSLKKPYIFRMADGSFGIVAVRTCAEGEADEESKGKVLFFVTRDFLQYSEVGLIDLHSSAYVEEVTCNYDENRKVYAVCWSLEGKWFRNEITDLYSLEAASQPDSIEAVKIQKVNTDIEGIVPGNMISVPEETGRKLKFRLSTPFNIAMELPEEVKVTSRKALKSVKAKAIYNDGTTAYKTVDWDTAGIDWNKSGTYEITGTIRQEHYDFPMAVNRADPCIKKWNGKYYFIATNDADGNNSLYIREAASIPELVNAQEKLLLDAYTYEHIKGFLWAPEFHAIGEDLYIFHAATSSEFLFIESHVMKLKKGGNPSSKEDWSIPQRVLKKDGTFLCESGKVISLDMTVIPWNNEYYAAWSERQFVPVDLGAWIYIAKIDPKEPWKLVSDPVLLTKPDYGWANNHVFVDEGPFALITDKKLFLSFASAMIDATYAVGMLTADPGANLLDSESWIKLNYPLLTSRSVPGEFGPGHNSYVTDDEGVIWNAYHARPGVDGPRSSGLRRVHFDIDGYPVLDLTEEKDVNPEIRNLSTKVIIG